MIFGLKPAVHQTWFSVRRLYQDPHCSSSSRSSFQHADLEIREPYLSHIGIKGLQSLAESLVQGIDRTIAFRGREFHFVPHHDSYDGIRVGLGVTLPLHVTHLESVQAENFL